MKNINIAVVEGNLTRDPEIREAGSSVVAAFSIACNDGYFDKNEKWVDTVDYIDIEAWGKQAENIEKYLFKGSPCTVTGRLKLDQWADKDGNKRSKLKVKADMVKFNGGKSKDDDDEPPRRGRSEDRGREREERPPARRREEEAPRGRREEEPRGRREEAPRGRREEPPARRNEPNDNGDFPSDDDVPF